MPLFILLEASAAYAGDNIALITASTSTASVSLALFIALLVCLYVAYRNITRKEFRFNRKRKPL